MRMEVNQIKDDFKNCKNDIELFIKKNYGLMVLIVMTALLTWGYELTNFTRTIDDEQIFSRGINVKLWISQNRFTIAGIRALIPYEIIPYWHNFLFILIICITALFFAFFMNTIVSDKLAISCMSAVFVSMPVHVYYESFAMYCEEMALAYLLTVVSVYCIFRWCKNSRLYYWAVAGCILEVMALGVYQGFVPVFIIMVCTVLISKIISKSLPGKELHTGQKNKLWSDLLRYIIVFALALFIYLCIGEGLKFLLHTPNDYLDSYFRWNKDSFVLCITEIVKSIKGCSAFPLVHRGYISIPFANFLFIVIILWGILKIKENRFLFILGTVGAFFSSVFFFIVMGGYMPPRAMLAMPIYVSVAVLIAIELVHTKVVRYIFMILAIFVVLYQSETAVKLNAIAENVQESDRARVESVSEVIAKLGQGSIPEEPVAFVNTPIAYESVHGEGDSSLGYSYFTLGRERLQAYFTLSGYDYNWCSDEDRVTAESIAEQMPGWPLEGSVCIKDGIIIVNFKDYIIDSKQ